MSYLLVGLSVQISGTSLFSRFIFVFCFLLVTGILCRFEFHQPVLKADSDRTEEPVPSEKDDWEGETDEESDECDEEDLLPPGVNQKLERRQHTDGSIELSGLLRADFLPNQTKVPLFVAFCPPFNQIPTVECFSLDGLAEVEIVQNAPHGVQLSIRKAQPVPLDDSVILTFRASY